MCRVVAKPQKLVLYLFFRFLSDFDHSISLIRHLDT